MERNLVFSLDWQEHADYVADIVNPPKEQLILPPYRIGNDPPEFRYMMGNQPELPPWRLAIFEEAALIGRPGLGITRKGGLIMDTVYDGKLNLYERYPFIAEGMDNPPPEQRLEGTVFPMMQMWWNAYFHWCLELLPKLMAVQAYGKQSSSGVTVLLGSDPPKFVTESMNLLGIPYVIATSESYVCERMLVASTARPFGRMYTEAVDWLTDMVVLAGQSQAHIGKRLYVSRNECEMRKVKNEDQLQGVLAYHGFKTIYPHKWSFDDQVSVFSSARVIMGGHGGGLLNALWGNAALIEFFEPGYVNPCIYTAQQAKTGAQDYGYVMGTGENGHLIVDPAQVELLLEEMGVQP